MSVIYVYVALLGIWRKIYIFAAKYHDF